MIILSILSKCQNIYKYCDVIKCIMLLLYIKAVITIYGIIENLQVHL